MPPSPGPTPHGAPARASEPTTPQAGRARFHPLGGPGRSTHFEEAPMRRHLRTPLARWGLTALALLAVATRQPVPAITCGTLAALAWKAR